MLHVQGEVSQRNMNVSSHAKKVRPDAVNVWKRELLTTHGTRWRGCSHLSWLTCLPLGMGQPVPRRLRASPRERTLCRRHGLSQALRRQGCGLPSARGLTTQLASAALAFR